MHLQKRWRLFDINWGKSTQCCFFPLSKVATTAPTVSDRQVITLKLVKQFSGLKVHPPTDKMASLGFFSHDTFTFTAASQSFLSLFRSSILCLILWHFPLSDCSVPHHMHLTCSHICAPWPAQSITRLYVGVKHVSALKLHKSWYLTNERLIVTSLKGFLCCNLGRQNPGF